MSSYPRHLRTTPNVYQSFYLNVDWLVVLNIFQMFAYMTQFSTDPQSPPNPTPPCLPLPQAVGVPFSEPGTPSRQA